MSADFKKWVRSALTALGVVAANSGAMAYDIKVISTNTGVFALSEAELAERKLEILRIGDLPLPDGKLAAMDPLVMPERAPFVRTVKPGTYPVSAIKEAGEYGRPALLVIRFSNEVPTQFLLSVIPGQDVTTLKEDYFFGIPVDAGLGAFANSMFFASVEKREAIERAKNSSYSNYYDNVLSDQMPGEDSDETLLHYPVEGEPGAAVISQSGWGDGFYPVVWGLNDGGNPVLAYIDFYVIDGADGRD